MMRLGKCLVAILVLPLFARADLEFVGVLATPKEISFALNDTAKPGMEWRTLNATFQGYTLRSYDRANDTLTLVKDGAELRLLLKPDAKIATARLELTGRISLGVGEKFEVSRATLRYDEDNVFPLKDGLTYIITPSRRPDGTLLFKIAVERTLAPNTIKRIGAPSAIVLPGQPFSLSIGELQFAFTPQAQ